MQIILAKKGIDIMKKIELIKESEFGLIENIFIKSCKNNKSGIGYPRCDELGELKSEILLYEQQLINSCYKIILNDKIIGAFIFLFDDEMDTTYLGGPVFKLNAFQYITQSDIVQFLDIIYHSHNGLKKKNKLLCCPLDENILLCNALTEKKWIRGGESLELKFELKNFKDTSIYKHLIKTLSLDSNKNDIVIVANLIGETHDWNKNFTKRIIELLNDGFTINYLCINSKIVSVIVWIDMKDTNFSRLDYMSTHKEHRKNGYANIPINYTLEVCKNRKKECVFLATSPSNINAIALYQKIGFVKNFKSVVYEI